MKSKGKSKSKPLAKQTAKVKVKRKLAKITSIEDAPFFKEKMRKGEEILSRVGLPKGY